MAAKKQTQTDKNLLYAVVVLVLVVVLFWALKVGEKNYAPVQPNTPVKVENTQPVINNSSDLDSASKELDANDLNAIDTGLNAVNSDSSSF